MKMLSITAISLIVLLSACATKGKENRENSTFVNPETGKGANTLEVMSSIDNFSLDTYPVNGSFLIASVTPRLQFDYEEEEYALLNASRQISIYFGAYISYQKMIDENIIGTVQKQQVDVLYDQGLALSFLDKLNVLETDRGLDYFSALIKTESFSLPDYPDIAMSPGERPTWINNPPDFEGFKVGVGVTGRRKTLYESWEMADKLAMAEIANEMNTNIKAGTATIERGGASSGASTSVIKSLAVSNVHIKGLYILSRWRDPDNSYYYSLAIRENP